MIQVCESCPHLPRLPYTQIGRSIRLSIRVQYYLYILYVMITSDKEDIIINKYSQYIILKF